MFGGQMFAEMLFAGSTGLTDPEPPSPNPDPGGGGAGMWPGHHRIPEKDPYDGRSEEDDIALALSLLL